uniref:PH domain-containing protein n=2 Tax=Lotharella oceanica TaxID=641309 RepID=A0A7S2X787_9EUKA|mmetsp:Transcript_14676/g.27851  ORF Transcript_14676/g.27851 Transcript_14676/m.27851 type:complete len:197 (+) Transcript_14676:28-618(+)
MSEDVPIFEGYLNKQGNFSGWKKRYFRLYHFQKSRSSLLYYYNNIDSPKENDLIDLNGVTCELDPKDEKGYRFMIKNSRSNKGRVYRLEAKSRKDCAQWVRIIRRQADPESREARHEARKIDNERKIHNLHSKVQETARLAYGSTVAIVQRGENLQEVGEKAEDFEEKAEHQAETAKSVKRRMYCFNCSPCCWWCC